MQGRRRPPNPEPAWRRRWKWRQRKSQASRLPPCAEVRAASRCTCEIGSFVILPCATQVDQRRLHHPRAEILAKSSKWWIGAAGTQTYVYVGVSIARACARTGSSVLGPSDARGGAPDRWDADVGACPGFSFVYAVMRCAVKWSSCLLWFVHLQAPQRRWNPSS